MFLEVSTIGLGAVIGGIVTLPVLGFMIGPAFLKQGDPDLDLGPIADYPEGKFVVTTFTLEAVQGEVSRRTAYVRNNGLLERPAELHDPLEPLRSPRLPGAAERAARPEERDKVQGRLPRPGDLARPGSAARATAASTTPRATAPPAHLCARSTATRSRSATGTSSSASRSRVSHVDGTGAQAKIHKHTWAYPGEHVDGLESWLYPIQPPH